MIHTGQRDAVYFRLLGRLLFSEGKRGEIDSHRTLGDLDEQSDPLSDVMMVIITSIFLEIVLKPDYMRVGKTMSGSWWTAEGAQVWEPTR